MYFLPFDALRAVSHLTPVGNPAPPLPFSPELFSSSVIGDSEPREEGMELLLTDWTFGTEELSSYSRFAREGETTPELLLHPLDAARLDLAEGNKVSLQLGGGELVLQLGIASNMATGVIVVPRHRQVKWQIVKQWPTIVPDDRIRKG